ncbi:hypothetical protein P7L78_19190 [Tistrella bauzanensis]|uniref:hypothetical protein n=1 Tax=Tistrella TaxID=171436 RepID=UPI0031F690CE
MTKLRNAEEFEGVLFRQLRHIPPALLERITGLSRGHLAHCADPDNRKQLSVPAMVGVEVAAMLAGEEPGLLAWCRAEVAARAEMFGGDRRGDLPPLVLFAALVAEVGDVSRVLTDRLSDGRLCAADLRALLPEVRDVGRQSGALERRIIAEITRLEPDNG